MQSGWGRSGFAWSTPSIALCHFRGWLVAQGYHQALRQADQGEPWRGGRDTCIRISRVTGSYRRLMPCTRRYLVDLARPARLATPTSALGVRMANDSELLPRLFAAIAVEQPAALLGLRVDSSLAESTELLPSLFGIGVRPARAIGGRVAHLSRPPRPRAPAQISTAEAPQRGNPRGRKQGWALASPRG